MNNEQRELDRKWLLNFSAETTAVTLNDLPMNQLVPFEDLLERNGVNTDDFTGDEKLSELSTATGLFAHLYNVGGGNHEA